METEVHDQESACIEVKKIARFCKSERGGPQPKKMTRYRPKSTRYQPIFLGVGRTISHVLLFYLLFDVF